MIVELQINNSTNAAAQFVTWAPSPCRIRMTNPAGAMPPAVGIKLSSASAAGGGAVGFRTGASGAFASTLTLTVPTNGASVSFFTAGTAASSNNGDVRIEARAGNTVVGSTALHGAHPQERKHPEAARDATGSSRRSHNSTIRGSGGLPTSATCTRTRAGAESGARRARVPAVASRLSARSRARASGDRPERRAAVLALRSAGPEYFQAGLHGRVR